MLEPEPERQWLSLRPKDLRRLRDPAKVVEDPALERGGVGGAYLDSRQHVLPDARRSQERGGTELAQVALHRLRALRAVHAKAHHQAQHHAVERVPHPRHGQVGEVVVGRDDPLHAHERAGHRDHVVVGEHDALGVAGGARGVADERHVVPAPSLDLGREGGGLAGRALPTQGLHVRERLHPVRLVVDHPARIVVDHEPELRQPVLEGEDLVHLLLVLGHHHGDLGVVEDEGELLGDGVLVDGHGAAPEGHGRHLRPVQPGPIVTDHAQRIAAREPEGGQTEGEVAHLVVVLAPAVRLPDAPILLAQRRAVRELARIALHEARQRGWEVGHVSALRPAGLWCRPDRP
jgi:hypothetical protein